MYRSITFYIFSAVFLLFFMLRLPTELTADVWFFLGAGIFFLVWAIVLTIKNRRN